MPGEAAHPVPVQGGSVLPEATEPFVRGALLERSRDSPREAEAAWRAAYKAKLGHVLRTPAKDYHESAARLSELIRTKLLLFSDLKQQPSRFFEAHRLLVNHGFEQGPGFSIRFTVQFNLFAGTVLELGGPRHLAMLDEMQEKGILGCFALTERLAAPKSDKPLRIMRCDVRGFIRPGVNSGLVVQTTAEWRPENGQFLLRTPHDGACKNWISQGLTATKAVVMADLIVNGKSKGPHAFLIDLRDASGRPTPGIVLGDMGEKTTGNDLDNAHIRFEDKWIGRTTLLDRHCDVTDAGEYVHRGKKALSNMELIGQRLFTGRVAVAQGAHEFRLRLFRRTRAHNDIKSCLSPGGGANGKTLMLSSIPQLRSLYAEADVREARMSKYLAAVEAALCDVLRRGGRPSASLVEACAAAKVRAVDEAIDFCHRLRQEVGSYALMAGTGFEHTDFLQCCKFAEGDSRILMMKVARDRVKMLAATKKAGRPVPSWMSPKEVVVATKLIDALAASEARGVGPGEAWDEQWEMAYALADIAIEGIITHWVGAKGLQAGLWTVSKL